MREFKISERITMRTGSIDRYLSEISKIPLIDPAEEAKIAEKAATGDRAAIDQLVKVNLRFVVSVAKMYHGGSSSKFEDLINEGNHGLIEAAELFDPSTGFKFISYAIWHIRKYMLKYLTDNARTIRIPQNKVVALNKMSHIESDLMSDLGRTPTSDEVMEAYTEMVLIEKGNETKPEDIRKALIANSGVSPLDSPFNSNDDSDSLSPIDIINGDTSGTDHLATEDNALRMLTPFLNILSATDKEIMMLRHGFRTEGESMAFREIGDRLGYTAERVRQRYKKSIRVLRRRIRIEKASIDAFL